MKIRNFILILISLCTFSLHAQIESVGLIGSATPFGWDADTNLVQTDTLNPSLFSIEITLVDGEAKFRANDNWDINWGATDFPTGVGEQGGPNIPVLAGDYIVSFDTATAEYNFAVQSSIGIIGDATPGGWDEDTNMWEDTNGIFFITLDLVPGGAKFRKDDDWAVNWGGAFPADTGVQDGPNIDIPKAGTYYITFDTTSSYFTFTEIISLDSVMIIGSATDGGWESGTLMTQDANNADIWRYSGSLMDGGAQFTANGGELVWGGPDFPMGTATSDGDTIPVVGGDYQIEFNTETGEYNFLEVRIFETIGLIGSATPGGWDADTPMERDAADSSKWSLRVELLQGEAKFRADMDWIVNWGSGDFPSGVGTQDGANIPVEEGDYIVSFNSITGAYNFELVVEYDAISLVGKSGPAGEWPGDDASNDWFLNVSEDDPQMWSGTGVTLTDHMGASDEGVKFRADTAWAVNWGAEDFPSGVGTQDGPNIITVAGTYDVTFNSATGEYFFGPLSSTEQLLRPDDLKLFPNPTSNYVELDISKLNMQDEFQFFIFNMNGQQVKSKRLRATERFRVETTDLQAGNYLIQIVGNGYLVGKKFTVIR